MEEVIKVEDCVKEIGDYNIPIYNAIIIPNNATNGDVVKAMFPVQCKNMGNENNGIVVDFYGDLHTFDKDWWNAPYKKGEE